MFYVLPDCGVEECNLAFVIFFVVIESITFDSFASDAIDRADLKRFVIERILAVASVVVVTGGNVESFDGEFHR